MSGRSTRLIVALDTKDTAQAMRWRAESAGYAGAVKLGLEFTYARGLEAVRDVAGDSPLFLDLKLHDIPNTVASAIGSLKAVQPAMLTIHAAGGRAMIAAARQAIDGTFPDGVRPLLLAVTVLTSMDTQAMHEIGVEGSVEAQVVRLGRLAMESGADGLVCSSHEITPLRAALGEAPVLVVPGIRPAGSAVGDQKRIMTPAQARAAGADWIVVGRPITRAADPAAAAAAIAAELSA
ncbi:orotidine-5'-phosphate decarboxylase [Komagataeibacter intermedius]|uniref:Orotidine 5'-phosphate decarboxylase n=2 Tax=Komagataeibacter intermedius TaxID=66229 RepID=A0A0N1FRP1_9PROT|nr:orotidine-5'-phosphate decarboxylase [Komagataeibacter intermedius]KPH88707.1 orotidine 5'-phosphate decarboxylase [Komagataeibacter intermedius AF2]MCF3637796.1 orotidine-5'-phosphate decarboxylase [Komagataeibacter intermedius]GAN86498.1 orotidine 5'-phosphate decarboxylase [Komagataeibacter intermedius TF2]GBQ72566.1 orotidine 5'-phosphate decarboxylase [Komagataeibacter intermedius NRIC 0521]